MQIKYKLRNKETGEVFVNVRGYMLHKNGDVESIILNDGTPITTENIKFCRFMEVVDGIDVYDGDKATVIIKKMGYNMNTGEYYTEGISTVNGTFREMYEEGLYYLVDDETGKDIVYTASDVTILSIT